MIQYTSVLNGLYSGQDTRIALQFWERPSESRNKIYKTYKKGTGGIKK